MSLPDGLNDANALRNIKGNSANNASWATSTKIMVVPLLPAFHVSATIMRMFVTPSQENATVNTTLMDTNVTFARGDSMATL